MGWEQDQERWVPALVKPSSWEAGVWTGRCSAAAAGGIWHDDF